MPTIKEKWKHLQGDVLTYVDENRPGFYYRELVPGTKRYRVRRIEGANCLSDALRDAYKALLDLSGTIPQPVKPNALRGVSKRRATVLDAVEEWLKYSEQRVAAGLKDEAAHIRRCVTLRTHLPAYLKEIGVTYVDQITETTFESYPIYRRGVMKNTRKTELKEIGIFLRQWLGKHKLLSKEIAMSPDVIPRIAINPDDLDANPAISQHDYLMINGYIRNEWLPAATNKNSRYFRNMFWCFIHVLKNSGMRPKELLSIRLKDITIVDHPRYSVSNKEEVSDYKATILVRKSKTGKPRDVICRSNAADRILAFRRYQDHYFVDHDYKIKAHGDMLLFGKPDELMDKCYSYRHMDNAWRDVCNGVKDVLEGNRFSDRPYTIYSLRSTFIENCILDNIDIYTVATLCGNSVKIIQKYYDRHDVLKKADSIQEIKRGQPKKQKPKEVSLF
jgi:integrase